LHNYPGSDLSQDGPGQSTEKQLFIDERPVMLEYASSSRQSNVQSTDWICSSCNKSNFGRRQECFVCAKPRGEDSIVVGNMNLERGNLAQIKVLIVSGIHQGTTEEQVNDVFREFGPVEAVRLTPDGTRAYVEYFTAEQAQYALSICNGQKGILRIGQALVSVTMANLGFNSSNRSNPVGFAALQAAQWASHNQTIDSHQSAVVNTSTSEKKAEPLSEWPTPFDEGGMTYRVDPESGLYFEEKSGYYFDYSNKTYYSTVKKKHYKYENKSFVECEAPSTKVEGSSKPKKSKEKKGLLSFSIDGSIRKKIEEQAKEAEQESSSQKKAEVKGSATKLSKVTSKKAKEISKNIEQWNINQKKLGKLDKPVCLLCRRKFKSVEKLKRHELKSEMHKENLRKKKMGISKPISVAEPKTVEQATKAAEAAGYVDRAGERRKAFGQDAKPLSSSSSKNLGDANRIETPIHVADQANKGASLLKAMGWKEGEGLGRNKDGIAAPIGLDGKVQNS